MKKLLLIIYFLIAILFLTSCGGHFFNPRYYYNNKGDSSGGNNPLPPPPPPDGLPDGVEDPFDKGEWNNPDYGGYNGSKFDTWLFQSSFRGDKLPIYNFKEPEGKVWIAGGKDWKGNLGDYYIPNKGENKVYDAPVVGTIDISPLKIYKYNGKNPLYDSIGYLPGRMDRFRFYSIDGEASIDLKQYLIAVDTYSKLIFAYGKITRTGNLFGNVYPTDFDAIERYGQKIAFYEYDPIGYVESTGKVILYEHYETEFVRSPTGYIPSQHGYDTVAQHDKSKPGRSPYLIILDEEAGEEDKKTFYNNASSLVSKDFNWRDYSGYESTAPTTKKQIDLEKWKSLGYAGKSLILYTYTLTDSANKFIIKETDFNTKKVTTKEYNIEKITSTNKASYTNSSGESLSVIIQITDSSKTISVSGKVLDPNFKDYGPIFVDRIKDTYFKRDGSTSIGGGIGGISSSTFPLSSGGKLKDLEYKFSSDGTEFTMKYQYDVAFWPWQQDWKTVEYKFKLARFDSDGDKQWTAKYECLNLSGKLGKYTRVVLRNGDGTDSPGPSEIGTVVRSSMTLHRLEGAIDLGFTTIPDDPTSNLGLEMISDKR
ncbi:hypothetical protein [Brachyspira sp.]|uniref:hypothetical protein n=1 Tax=Brachyspira sp. TaxID=1977261 RepID=UPI00262EB68B|nr:hypothetical protein [Brachyspira sp.]